VATTRTGAKANACAVAKPRRFASKLKEIFEQSYHGYGSPRVVRALRLHRVRTSKTRVRRLMQEAGLCARQKRRLRPCTTQREPRHTADAACINLMAQLPEATTPSQRFVSDITYIPTQEGFLYLAATNDVFTRRCAGWCA
jgi:putative transposase